MSTTHAIRLLGALLLVAAMSCAESCDATTLIAGPPTVSLAMGTVRVESEPTGALVRIGQRPLGTTPVTLTVLTFEDAHTLTLELEGYAPQELELLVQPTEQRVERAIMEPVH